MGDKSISDSAGPSLGTLTGPVGEGEHPWVLCPLHGAGASPGAPRPLGVSGTQVGTRMVTLTLPGASSSILGIAEVSSPPPAGCHP